LRCGARLNADDDLVSGDRGAQNDINLALHALAVDQHGGLLHRCVAGEVLGDDRDRVLEEIIARRHIRTVVTGWSTKS
jgi:hypothetical protein